MPIFLLLSFLLALNAKLACLIKKCNGKKMARFACFPHADAKESERRGTIVVESSKLLVVIHPVEYRQ